MSAPPWVLARAPMRAKKGMARQPSSVVYPVYMTPLVAWIMVGFFREVPREMEEAALIDGCSQWGLFWRVVLPVAAPGFSTNKGILWGEMAAVGVTASIPVIAFALIVQKRLVRGLTLGAVQ